MKNQREIIFVRHGETEMNRKNLYFGHLDPQLNSLGREQLKKSGISLGTMERDIDKIYCSPLKRCVESLELLNLSNKIDVVYENEFKEMNFGILEGKSYGEILEEYPEIAKEMEKNWKYFKIPKGESLQCLQERVVEKLEEIMEKYGENKILVVAHAGVIKVALSYYLYGNLDGYWKLKIDNGGISKIVRLEDGFTYIDYINRI